jgi:putative copper resistance protein D
MEGALALCRFAHLLAAMTLFGASLYSQAFAPPDLARALAPAARRIAAIAIPVTALSALVWLALEAASMADSWSGLVDADVLQGVLMDTAFGAAWQGRLVVALALLIALALGRRGPSSVTLALSGLLLASLCLVGHASMQAGAAGALHRANHALHLLAAGAWLGGLPLFGLCLRAYCDPALRRDAVTAMRRFSFWGQFDVALVVLTGAVNVALTSGAAPFPPTTPYRALLCVKIALVAMMIAIALVNRYALAPRLEPGAPALGIMMTTSFAEVVLGAGVVALVSVFGLLNPF